MNEYWENIIEALTIYFFAPIVACIVISICAMLVVFIPWCLLAFGVWLGNGDPVIGAVGSFGLLVLVIVLGSVVYTFLEKVSRKE